MDLRLLIQENKLFTIGASLMKKIFPSVKTVQDFQKRLLRFFVLLFFIGILVFISSTKLLAQSVVVSGYFNAADVRDEWTELLVVSDNVDMRNWTIRDNNGNQDSWQTAVTFANVSLWSNLRAGTIIILYHRVINSSGASYTQDVDPADGYLQLHLQNTSYFSGGDFATSPFWSGNSMSIAGPGDIVQLRNSSGTHIHALGHRSTVGANWTALPSPKLNHKNSASSGDAIYVCPGSTINDYGTNTPQDGTTYTTKNATTLTFGLPNSCGGSNTINSDFWRSLREPAITMQTTTSSTAPTYPVAAATFFWDVATDPNPADNTVGYMILRNANTTFDAPTDGTTYSVGYVFPGGGEIIALMDNPGGTVTSYTDYGANDAGTYCYRIYPYRYSTDQPNGNSYDLARGVAYNTTNYVTVVCGTNPLPIEMIRLEAKQDGGNALVQWTTATEMNTHHFNIEKSNDGILFTTIGRIAAAGNSVVPIDYSFLDNEVENGISYYRISTIDWDGSISFSPVVALNYHQEMAIEIFQSFDFIRVLGVDESMIHVSLVSISGQILSQTSGEKNILMSTQNIPDGMYLLFAECNGFTTVKKLLVQH
ncbi:MAG: T9SS type A sorting domain-containing protein [Flavobacteriales bacterium]|nr:T9SS type A sorting domain-containing protein [Flavobacteriales bacterium]